MLDAVNSWFAWFVGSAGGKSTYVITRWVFLRALGLIYLIAFVSFWVQIKGLIGGQGILPAQQFLHAVKLQLGGERYRVVPTMLWLGAGDGALHLVCALGAGCALLVILNVAPGPSLLALWVLYLSLASAGQDFMAFQWDVLLLETGLLAVFFAPWQLLPGRGGGGEGGGGAVSPLALALLWWLLFRLTFQSGVVKLTSGDPTWRNLTALDFHFFTQPLPTWTAWYVQQLPQWFKKFSVVATYVLEIGFPLLIFGTRGMRLAACAGTVFFQLLILATGNYNFFNLLTIALALLLLDDAVWVRILPGSFAERFSAGDVASAAPTLEITRVAVAVVILVVSSVKLLQTFWPVASRPSILGRAIAWVEPFRSVNSYGLFRVMTTRRPEIIVEGSYDGTTWQAYEFKYKPGDVTRRPRFVEPHQPRLDWQMWFAALAPYDYTPWFQAFAVRLLRGSPDVLALLARSPFPATRPPKYLRALLYQYRFTTPAEKRQGGGAPGGFGTSSASTARSSRYGEVWW